MKINFKNACRFIAFGSFFTAFHLNVGPLTVFPPFVGFAMVAMGMMYYECILREKLWIERGSKESKELLGLRGILIALAALSLLQSVLKSAGVSGIFGSSWFLYLLLILEAVGYTGIFIMLEKDERKVRKFNIAYIIVEVIGIVTSIAGTYTANPAILVTMAFFLMLGRLIFFAVTFMQSLLAGR